MQNFFPIFLATFIAFLAFLGGGLLSHRFSHFLAKYASSVIAFGSGAMLAITFKHVLPEAIKMGGEYSFLAILGGVVFFFVLEHFFYLHGCVDRENHEECENHHLGPLASFGIGIHSFFDGVLIVFSFLANPILGWFTALGIFLHKLPAGAILHSLICFKKKKANLWWIFWVALTTPLATLIIPFAQNLPSEWIGLGLGFSAGTLLYITLSDLLPETHQTKTKLNLLFLALGMSLIFLLNAFFSPHLHSHEEDEENHHHDEIHLHE